MSDLTDRGEFFQPLVEYVINQDGAKVIVIREWMSSYRADRIMHQFMNLNLWVYGAYQIRGRRVPIPRGLLVLRPDDRKRNSYRNLPYLNWSRKSEPVLREIRKINRKLAHDPIIKQEFGHKAGYFNHILLEYFRGGLDSISARRYERGDQLTPIFSMGQSRTIVFRSINPVLDRKHDIIKVSLDSGDLLLMNEASQRGWTNSIPKDRHIERPRVSMLFQNLD